MIQNLYQSNAELNCKKHAAHLEMIQVFHLGRPVNSHIPLDLWTVIHIYSPFQFLPGKHMNMELMSTCKQIQPNWNYCQRKYGRGKRTLNLVLKIVFWTSMEERNIYKLHPNSCYWHRQYVFLFPFSRSQTLFSVTLKFSCTDLLHIANFEKYMQSKLQDCEN